MSEIEIAVKRLPSTGKKYDFKKIILQPLVYKEILAYQSELEKSKNAVSDYICQLKNLILPIKHGDTLLMYDVPAVMALRAYGSVCKEINSQLSFSYECPVHHKKETLAVSLDKFHFNEIDKTYSKVQQIKLNEEVYDFKLPTVKDFLFIADTYKTRVPLNNALKYLLVLSHFSDLYEDSSMNKEQILYAVLNAKYEDVLVLEWLYKQITGCFDSFMANCKNEGGEPVMVKIDSLIPITDIFQNILLTGLSSEIPIILGEDD